MTNVIKKTRQIFLYALATAVVLCPSALKDWALEIKDPILQPIASLISDVVSGATNPLKSDSPLITLRSTFLDYRKTNQFNFAMTTPLPIEFFPQSPLQRFSLLSPQQLEWRSPAGVETAATSTPSVEAPPVESIKEPETPASPHYLALGDSMLKTALSPVLQELLEREIPHSNAEIFAKSATGLARPEFFNWPEKVKELTHQKKYDAIFVFLGTNDTQGIQVDHTPVTFGSESWKSIYEKRVRTMTEMLCSATTKVYWVGVPPMRDARYDSHVSTLNSLVQHTVDHCAKFIPAPQEIRAKDGSFASYLNFSGQSVRIREKDGIHLSMEGAKIFARSLIQELKKGFQ